MSSGLWFAILAGVLATAWLVAVVVVTIRGSRLLEDPRRAWEFVESRSHGGSVLLAIVYVWMITIGVVMSALMSWAVVTGRAGWEGLIPVAAGLAGAAVGVWWATAWPYHLSATENGLEMSFLWARKLIPWATVERFRYYGPFGRLPVLGVLEVVVRLRYRKGNGERPRFAMATFMLPVMDVGPPTGEPVYVTVLDRHIPDRRLTQ